MAISELEAAKRVCSRSGWTLCAQKLQRILYAAHMIHLHRAEAPLIKEPFLADDAGPMLAGLNERLSGFGSGPVKNLFHSVSDITDDSEEAKTLDEALDRLGGLGPGALAGITRLKGGAWHRIYQPGVIGLKIPDELILREYREALACHQENKPG